MGFDFFNLLSLGLIIFLFTRISDLVRSLRKIEEAGTRLLNNQKHLLKRIEELEGEAPVAKKDGKTTDKPKEALDKTDKPVVKGDKKEPDLPKSKKDKPLFEAPTSVPDCGAFHR